jgi:hypothetical protein
VQWSNRLIMVDTSFTLCCWWAGLAFAHWAKTGTRRAALAAGLLSAAGLLTKVNSMYLFLLPVSFFLLTRRWDLLRKSSFWIIPATVAAVWGPWFLLTRQLTKIGFGGLVYKHVIQVAADLGLVLLENLLWFAPLFLLGLVRVLRRERHNYCLLVCGLLPFSYAIFLLVARVGVEARFLIPILAPLIVLVGAGLSDLASWLARPWLPAGRLRILLAAVGVAGFVVTVGLHRDVQPVNQVRPVVEFLRGRGAPETVSVLVPCNAEGPFIAEFAMRDPHRPARLAVRPTKLLSVLDWSGRFYQQRYRTPDELVSLFDRFPVRYTVVPAVLGSNCYPQDVLLKGMLGAHSERWTIVSAPRSPWLVYQRTDGRELPPAVMEVFARQVLSVRLRSISEITFGHR